MSDGITEARRGTYWKSNKYETLENNMEKRNTWTYNDTKVNVPKTNERIICLTSISIEW
jgi:hypothetical protein